jgi:hypothetical protein
MRWIGSELERDRQLEQKLEELLSEMRVEQELVALRG